MTSALDIYRRAQRLIDQHGVKAVNHAAMNADACREHSDMDGHHVWMRIIVAIKDLQSQDWPHEDHDWPQEDHNSPPKGDDQSP